MGPSRIGAALASLLLGGAALVFAHDRGPYAVDEFFILDVSVESPALVYIAHLGEVPSVKEWRVLDADGNGVVTEAEKDGWLDRRAPELADGLFLSLDGRRVTLAVAEKRLDVLLSPLGMEELRISLRAVFTTPAPFVPDRACAVEIRSTNFPDQNGLFETTVLLGARENATPLQARPADGTQETFATDGAGNPVFRGAAPEFRFVLEPANADKAVAAISDDTGLPGASHGRAHDHEGVASFLTRLIDLLQQRDPTLTTFLLGLVIAVGMGMGHALSPGHGKTVMAAYLIGERGTYVHAMLLGLTVTITHTWSVFLLGVVTLAAGSAISEDRLTFWTGVLSGLIICGIGALLFQRRLRDLLHAREGMAAATAQSHNHPHEHGHTWTHTDGHGHEHRHDLVSTARPGYAHILWLGVSGGIVPCPAALIVLLLALKLGQLPYGLALLVAFSAGLAIVLVTVGVLVVRGAQAVRRRAGEQGHIFLVLPVVSAAFITVLGGAVVLWTLIQYGLLDLGA